MSNGRWGRLQGGKGKPHADKSGQGAGG